MSATPGALSALPKTIASIAHPALRRSLSESLSRLKGGASIASAFADSALLASEDRFLLASGEDSGNLDHMLERIERRQVGSLEDLENQLIFWMPKLVYFVFLAWAAYQVEHSHLAILAGLAD